MQYGNLLKRAWNIIWRNKIMWVFGFLAALGSGGGGGGGGGGSGRVPSGELPGPGGLDLPPDAERALTRLFTDQTIILIIVAVFVIAVLISLVIALLSALGHGALVEMAREADDTETTNFGAGWNVGVHRMFPVFLIRFLLGLPPALLIILGLAPFLLSFIPLLAQSGGRDLEGLFAGGTIATLLGCAAPACCIAVLLAIPLSVLETLAIRALVLEEQGIVGSIKRGWAILTRNLGEVVIVWLIFLVVGIAVGVLIGLPLTFVAIAALVPLGIASALSPIMLVPLVMLICFIALLSAALRSIVEAYTSTVWTLAYRQWMAGPAPAPAPVQVVA